MLNIEVTFTMNGEPVQVNKDLKELIDGIVDTYVSQKVFSAPKVEGKTRKPRTNYAYWTQEQVDMIITKSNAMRQEGHSYYAIAQVLAEELQTTPKRIAAKIANLKTSSLIN